ncbi:MAG: DUF3500 domain-containing protein [Dehalococcoidia bacterium]
MVTSVRQRRDTAALMFDTTRQFLAALTKEQRAAALLPFDRQERLNWHFTPKPRRGLPLKQMSTAQKQLAHALLSAGLSQGGYVKATTIMSLEQVLHEYEQIRRFVRDADIYFFSIFGEPSADQTWGWRVEGHHVSLNFTLVGGKLTSSSPSFFGANPAEVKQGPRKGLRVLAAEEELGRELLRTLDGEQRRAAVIDPVAPPDLLSYNRPLIDPDRPTGVRASALSKTQQEILKSLMEEYAEAMPAEVAAGRLEQINAVEPSDLFFAWAGSAERGEGHYYRVQAPAFLIEYDCTQDQANHIHSVWRDYQGDFGRDLLQLHYQDHH